MRAALGTGSIDPYTDDFFRKVIEERKGKPKSDPLYYFLKILANAGCYGIYAEVNKLQVGKNKAKKIGIFSGELSGTERTCIMEVPGPWYFPPVASLITAGGRLPSAHPMSWLHCVGYDAIRPDPTILRSLQF